MTNASLSLLTENTTFRHRDKVFTHLRLKNFPVPWSSTSIKRFPLNVIWVYNDVQNDILFHTDNEHKLSLKFWNGDPWSNQICFRRSQLVLKWSNVSFFVDLVTGPSRKRRISTTSNSDEEEKKERKKSKMRRDHAPRMKPRKLFESCKMC